MAMKALHVMTTDDDTAHEAKVNAALETLVSPQDELYDIKHTMSAGRYNIYFSTIILYRRY